MKAAELAEFLIKLKRYCNAHDCNACPLRREEYCACGAQGANAGYLTEEVLQEVINYTFPTDWTKVAVDTPIYVRDSENHAWKPGYFAEYQNGKVYAWVDGGTSFSKAHMTRWSYAKLANKEE